MKKQKKVFPIPFGRVFLSLTLFAVCFCPAAHASSVIAQMIAASKSVVSVDVEAGGVDPGKLRAFQYKTSGGGIIVDPSGIIVTNAHVLQWAMQITVKFYDGSRLPAEILHAEPGEDLVFLKVQIDKPLPALSLGDSDAVQLGNRVYSVGSSDLLRQTISEGEVTALGQKKNRAAGDPGNAVLQISFKLYPGDSGSPVLNERGEVVGITAAGQTSGSQQTFAISSNTIRKYLSKLP
ncbi:MAG TPA: trypsin-like peptidase domain-containing protein [Verrucomicrobiae bacterium]|jgi:serine protease Do|nr:trypsin-like peptidase domain-containing protein [Verrucomicrobiae bacterium]